MKSPIKWDWHWLLFLPLPVAVLLLAIVINVGKNGTLTGDTRTLLTNCLIILSGAIVLLLGYALVSLAVDHIESVRDGERRPWNMGMKAVLGLWLFVFFLLAGFHGDWELASLDFYTTVFIGLGISVVTFCIYFFPYMLANARKNLQESAILIVNLFAGWTVIAWLGALVWAFINDEQKVPPVDTQAVTNEEQVERLYSLYQKGIITEQEFSQKKKELLGL